MNIFSYDSKFSQVILRAAYSCWLNLLWIICSIPVITCGAATTALYSVMFRIADDRELHLTKDFFKAFRENFAQATRIWMIMLVLGGVLAADGYIVYRLRASSSGIPAVGWTLIFALLICAAIVYVIEITYIFPLTARFRNSDFNMMKNSLLIGIRYLFCTIMVFGIHFAMFYAIVALFTPLVIFGEGMCALLSSSLLLNVFRAVSAEDEAE